MKRFSVAALGCCILHGTTQARLIFTNEESTWDGSSFTLDVADEATNIDLKFGNSLAARIQYDTINDVFKFNRDVDFEGNEIQNVRLEQLAAAPTCDVAASGRIYFNTTDSHTYACQNLVWTRLDQAGGSGMSVNESEQTTDYDALGVNSINVLSATSTNRPSDHQYVVKTHGDTNLKTQVATRTSGSNERYYRVFESAAWSAWQEIKTKKYGGYTIQDIDQTDGTASYIGRQRDSDGKWLITLSQSGGFTYAQEDNNGGTTDYATAWANRLTLVYGSTFNP